MSTISVRNPHSVLAALESRPEDVVSITIPSSVASGGDDAWKRVEALARTKRVRMSSAPSGGDARRAGKGGGRENPEGGRTSFAEAQIKAKEPVSAEELFTDARERKGGKGLWIALDTLQDPHNVGAIFRAAAFFGVEGILLTSERSAPLSGTVYDVACGGVESVPHTLQVNLQRAFEFAKEAGLWILGTSEHAKESYLQIERDRPWLLVLGNEEKGMRRLTEEACDVLCQIPPQGAVTSLNVSVAAGIFISRLTQT